MTRFWNAAEQREMTRAEFEANIERDVAFARQEIGDFLDHIMDPDKEIAFDETIKDVLEVLENYGEEVAVISLLGGLKEQVNAEELLGMLCSTYLVLARRAHATMHEDFEGIVRVSEGADREDH